MKRSFVKHFIALIAGILLASCSKDLDDGSSLSGRWIEVSPVAERTELFFNTGNLLSRTDADGNTEMYNYRIEGEAIQLSLTGDVEGSSTLFFEQVTEDSFEIGNLYPHFPEAEPVIMTFRRK